MKSLIPSYKEFLGETIDKNSYEELLINNSEMSKFVSKKSESKMNVPKTLFDFIIEIYKSAFVRRYNNNLYEVERLDDFIHVSDKSNIKEILHIDSIILKIMHMDNIFVFPGEEKHLPVNDIIKQLEISLNDDVEQFKAIFKEMNYEKINTFISNFIANNIRKYNIIREIFNKAKNITNYGRNNFR